MNYGLVLSSFGSLAVDAEVIGVAALSLTALFFIGPALAAQASRHSIFGLLEHSFGSIPTLFLRVCAVAFLSRWIADLVAVPALWALAYVRERPLAETTLMAAGIVVFLFLTGLQSVRTSARLALFTNKLCIAILIAALIRQRPGPAGPGWEAVLAGFPISEGGDQAVQRICHGLSQLAFYMAPLLLLAAGSAARCAGRKQVALSGLTGLVLPIFGVLTLSVVIGVATGGQQGPPLAAALFASVANSAVSSRMFIVVITTFGGARFGVRALLDAVSLRPLGRSKWVVMGCSVAVITWLSLHHYDLYLAGASEISATCLVVAGAVVTADFVSGRPQFERVCKVDRVAVAAFMAGMVVPLSLPSRYGWLGPDGWWFPWVTPSYLMASDSWFASVVALWKRRTSDAGSTKPASRQALSGCHLRAEISLKQCRHLGLPAVNRPL